MAVPALTPVTTPVPEPTVAIPMLPLVHVPPAGVEFNVVVKPVQTVAVPVMAVGVVFTVTACETKHPPLSVYVILAVPALTPETTPVPDPTVAIPTLPLVHVPPAGVELSVVVAPAQITAVPVMAVGAVLTVTVWDAVQLPIVYEMTAVPALTPKTTPVPDPTVATPVLALTHVPPAGVELSVVVVPTHTLGEPVMGEPVVLTVTSSVTKHPPLME